MVVFAVVGHPNKGKSSLVTTLSENDRILVGAIPGTTKRANRYDFSIDAEVLYSLVDTPGFQRAKAVLDWLEAHAKDASDRSNVVAQFVRLHEHDGRFYNEVELLRPIVAGAGILYVVDGAKPYGPEFEIEMQILRWTGNPRLALINLTAQGDYIGQWQSALAQYFSIVRVFDARRADFASRLHLLSAFSELNEAWRPFMSRAIDALVNERRRRLVLSATEVANALLDCMSYTESAVLTQDHNRAQLQHALRDQLRARLQNREAQARHCVQSFYGHSALQRREEALRLLDVDLFAERGWALFGLSKMRLMVTGTAAGALAGLSVDALAGGTTLLFGASVGALVGGVGTWLGGDELAKAKVLGSPLGGTTLRVGPVSAPNFPWVFLGRAWAHHHLVAERNHALRDAISTVIAEQGNVMDRVDHALRRELAQIFLALGKEGRTAALVDRLKERVITLLEASPGA